MPVRAESQCLQKGTWEMGGYSIFVGRENRQAPPEHAQTRSCLIRQTPQTSFTVNSRTRQSNAEEQGGVTGHVSLHRGGVGTALQVATPGAIPDTPQVPLSPTRNKP